MMLNKVVLPAPFGPIMAKISAGRTENDTPSTALTPPNSMPRSRASSMSSPPGEQGGKRRHDAGAQEDHAHHHDQAERNVFIVAKDREHLWQPHQHGGSDDAADDRAQAAEHRHADEFDRTQKAGGSRRHQSVEQRQIGARDR